jgi:hypothetical protein
LDGYIALIEKGFYPHLMVKKGRSSSSPSDSRLRAGAGKRAHQNLGSLASMRSIELVAPFAEEKLWDRAIPKRFHACLIR